MCGGGKRRCGEDVESWPMTAGCYPDDEVGCYRELWLLIAVKSDGDL